MNENVYVWTENVWNLHLKNFGLQVKTVENNYVWAGQSFRQNDTEKWIFVTVSAKRVIYAEELQNQVADSVYFKLYNKAFFLCIFLVQ